MLCNGRKRNAKTNEWFNFKKAKFSVNYWDLEEGKRSYNYRDSWNAGIVEII